MLFSLFLIKNVVHFLFFVAIFLLHLQDCSNTSQLIAFTPRENEPKEKKHALFSIPYGYLIKRLLRSMPAPLSSLKLRERNTLALYSMREIKKYKINTKQNKPSPYPLPKEREYSDNIYYEKQQ